MIKYFTIEDLLKHYLQKKFHILFYREMGLESSYVLEKICRKVIDTYNMELREATRFYRKRLNLG